MGLQRIGSSKDNSSSNGLQAANVVTVDSQQVAATDIETRPWSWLDYRHGLRASEVCDLQWHQVELDHGRMHVRRAKNGTPSVHPIWGDEIRLESPTQDYVSVTERGR